MSVELETDFLTVAEAARLLKVSPVTVKRWLKQGRLPGYQVGPRAIRIRRSDLAALLLPRAGAGVNAIREATPVHTQIAIRPLTDEEVNRALEVLREARALGERILARRKGKPLSSSWRLIRQAREGRSKQL